VAGYDGVINDYCLVRAASFRPRGSMSDEELVAENIAGFRWWPPREIADYRLPWCAPSPGSAGCPVQPGTQPG
jgi:hypothetical protein